MGTLVAPVRTSVVHPGDLIEGRYRVLEVIAQGGMGSVFLAEHTMIKRRVAIKVLHPELAGDLAMIKRFMNEASAAGTLGHPNIVESTDMGFTPERVPFIVFEYLEGALLTDEIYRVGGMTPRRALRIAMQIASALEAAHAANIIHLDLKCDNVFLTDKDGAIDHVKVLDFGIAKFMEHDPVNTQRNVVMGTPEFMSPEQVTTPEQVDARSDIYALGVVMYEMLTARRPYEGEDPRILLHRIVHESPRPLGRAGVPPELEAMIFERMLAKDPAARFQSMREVQTAFATFVGRLQAGDSVPPPLRTSRQSTDSDRLARAAAQVRLPMAPRSRWPGSLFALAVIAGLAGGGLLYAEQRMASSIDEAATQALAADAAQLATLLDSQARAARQRVQALASAPVLRAAIETDAATIADLAREQTLFTPGPGEVLELFQLHDGRQSGVLRIPASAAALAVPTTAETRIESDHDALITIVTAPITRQSGSTGGTVALRSPIDLAQLRGRLAGDALQATLLGMSAPVELLACSDPTIAGIELTTPVATPAELGLPPLSLRAVVRPQSHGKTLRTARYASWGFGALMLLAFVAIGSVRSRR